MITEIFISYSWWTILLVIITGLLYASLLYLKNPQNKLNSLVSVVLFIFRFLTVSFLAFLLLAPYVKTKKKHIEKPIIIMAHDNSSSVIIGNDSVNHLSSFHESINKLGAELAEHYDVDSYLFGSKIVEGNDVNYEDELSNYSDFFSHLNQNYSSLNVGAMVLIGDGIVNNGIDPVYAATDINYPIYTIALGDTIQSRELKIDDIRHNSIVYSGDIFPVEISISANMFDGSKTKISLFENRNLIQDEQIVITGNNYRKTVTFNVPASNSGKRRFKVVIDNIEGESVLENNSRNIFIDVVDSRKKILILAGAPHPDIGAIKQSLSLNPNLEVETEYISGFNKELTNYDLIVLYQLPSKNNSAPKVLKVIVQNEMPVLFVLGNQSRLSVFNNYFEGMNIISASESMTSAQFEANKQFTLFSFNHELENQLASFPPLSVPLGNYQIANGSEVLGWQRVMGLVTNFPLFAFYDNIGIRNAVIVGEGIWQWRIQNNVQYNSSDGVDAVLNKSVMYLMADIDKRKFKVISKGDYENRNDVTLIAELYNQSLELDNSAEVMLYLSNENKEQFNYVFSPFDNYYTLNLNKLPVGIYSYKATTKLGNNTYSDAGEFIVQHIDNESLNLNADHRMLNRLAVNHGGNMYFPNQVDELRLKIFELDNLKSKIHYQDKFIGLNSLVYILITLLALLSIEWFLRKYFGNY